jgi:hypothetical protein
MGRLRHAARIFTAPAALASGADWPPHASRALGCRELTLWTNDILVAPRRIYRAAGFRLVSEAPHHSFGRDPVGRTGLRAPAAQRRSGGALT